MKVFSLNVRDYMIKSNKFNLFLCSVFVCNTQFTNAGFEEDWRSIQSEIERFNESELCLSKVFYVFEKSGDYLTKVLSLFSNEEIFESVKTHLLQVDRSFNNIDTLLTKILFENITSPEIQHLALFEFPKIKNKNR